MDVYALLAQLEAEQADGIGAFFAGVVEQLLLAQEREELEAAQPMQQDARLWLPAQRQMPPL